MEDFAEVKELVDRFRFDAGVPRPKFSAEVQQAVVKLARKHGSDKTAVAVGLSKSAVARWSRERKPSTNEIVKFSEIKIQKPESVDLMIAGVKIRVNSVAVAAAIFKHML